MINFTVSIVIIRDRSTSINPYNKPDGHVDVTWSKSKPNIVKFKF